MAKATYWTVTDVEARKCGEQTGLDTLVVHTVNDGLTLENFDKNKPANADKLPVPLLVTIKIRGDVSAVEAGLKAARAVAESTTGVVAEHIIANPAEDTEKMLKLSGMDKA